MKSRKILLPTVLAVALAGAGVGVYLTSRGEKPSWPSVNVVSPSRGENVSRGALSGDFLAMTADSNGKASVFVRDGSTVRLWTITGSGKHTSLSIPALDSLMTDQSQVADAGDGSYYVTAGPRGLYKVSPTGNITHVISPESPSARFFTGIQRRAHGPEVTGVTVNDGKVFVSDTAGFSSKVSGEVQQATFVHRVAGHKATRIAGKVPTDTSDTNKGISKKSSDALDTVIPSNSQSGALAESKGTLYLHTGNGIASLRDGTIKMILGVPGHSTSLDASKRPFEKIGEAPNVVATFPHYSDQSTASGRLAIDKNGDIFYGAGPLAARTPSYGDSLTAPEEAMIPFHWHLSKATEGQRKRAKYGHLNQSVYRISKDGGVSVVSSQMKGMALAGAHLFIANDGCVNGDIPCTSRGTMVVEMNVPE